MSKARVFWDARDAIPLRVGTDLVCSPYGSPEISFYLRRKRNRREANDQDTTYALLFDAFFPFQARIECKKIR